MSCIDCQSFLNINTKYNKLICNKCFYIVDPLSINWNCYICSEKFTSNAKTYHPLDFKLIKLAIKDSILNKIPLFPEEMNCCLEIQENLLRRNFNNQVIVNEKKIYMKHKFDCKGLLYQGYLYNRKVVICSLCFTIVNYEKFIWFCPYCKKNFKRKLKSEYPINFLMNKNENCSNMEELKKKSSEVFIKNKSNLQCSLINQYKSKLESEFIELEKKENFEKNKNQEIKNLNNNILLKGNENQINCIKNEGKVIKINNEFKDKPILEKLNNINKNDSKISSNLNNFISNALYNKKSKLIRDAINNSNKLNFSINDLKDLSHSISNLNFSMFNIQSPDESKEISEIKNNLNINTTLNISNNLNSNNKSSLYKIIDNTKKFNTTKDSKFHKL